jgi:hypothetical protein
MGTSGKRQFTRRLRAACRTSASVLALLCGPSVAVAAGDTWEGTWERTELPGKHLFLTQTGSMVNGHYDLPQQRRAGAEHAGRQPELDASSDRQGDAV